MGKHIRNSLLALYGFLLTGLLATCKQPDTAPFTAPQTPTNPVVNAPSQKNAPPEVLAVSIPGVPAKNIGIDTVANLIRVSIPENYSLTSPTVSFTFSCTQCTVGYTSQSQSIELPLTGVGYSDPNRLIDVPISDAPGRSGSVYGILVRPTGTFEIIKPVVPLVVEARDYSSSPALQVRNFLDGQRTAVRLINAETGEQSDSFLSFCASANDPCTSPQFDRIFINTSGLLPGTYDLVLTKADLRQQSLVKAITVVRGKPEITGIGWGTADNTPIYVGGANLYDEFKPELLLTNSKNESARVAITGYDDRKSTAALRLPVTVKPGAYAGKLISTRGEMVLRNPIYVLRYPNQPILFNIRKSGQTTVETLDVGTPYLVALSSISALKKDRVLLTPIATGSAPLEVPLVIPNSYYLSGPDGGGVPNFTLPSTTPSGRYKISLRIYDSETTFRDSEPFDQEFVVR